MIDSILEGIGIIFVVLWLLASTDVIDFKLCISRAGTCSIEVHK